MAFHEKIKEYRKRAKLSQQALSDLAGISRRSYQYYESGQFIPDVDILKKLCAVLKCSPNDLLVEEPDVHEMAKNMALAFSGGKLPKEDRDAIFEIIQEAYEKSKTMNEKNYVEC